MSYTLSNRRIESPRDLFADGKSLVLKFEVARSLVKIDGLVWRLHGNLCNFVRALDRSLSSSLHEPEALHDFHRRSFFFESIK